MRISIANKDADTVRRFWLWIIVIIYIVLISAFGCFLVLYLSEKIEKSQLENSYQNCDSSNSDISVKIAQISKDIEKYQQENSNLDSKLSDLNNKNSILESQITNTSFELSKINTQNENLKLPRNIFLILGSLSLAGSIYSVPKAISLKQEFNYYDNHLNYIKPIYEISIKHTLANILTKQIYGDNMVLNLVKSFNKIPTKTEFYNSLNSYQNTVTIFETTENEKFGLIMHVPWDIQNSKIIDPNAYTVSYRNNGIAKIKNGFNVVNGTADFFQIGQGEIIIDKSGKGTAKAEIGFIRENPNGENSMDFYVKNGEFILSNIRIYSW